MAFKGYVAFHGTEQGTFKGGSPHHHDGIEALGFAFGVETPVDSNTGQASGKRQHKPIKIIKEFSAASPQILQACVTNEILQTVSFQFTEATGDGRETVYPKIDLTNATIVSVTRLQNLREEVTVVFENTSSNSDALKWLHHAIFLSHVA